MKRNKKKVFLMVISIFIVLISLVLNAFIILHNHSPIWIVKDQDIPEWQYYCIHTSNKVYPLIDEKTIEKGYFTEETQYRLDRTIWKNDYTIVKGCNMDSKIHFSRQSLAKIDIDKETTIYAKVSTWNELDLAHDYYAEKGFTLPAYSSDNISKIEFRAREAGKLYASESDIPIALTLDSADEIDAFFNNYEEYFDMYQKENQPLVECTIYYKSFKFIEYLVKDDLDLLIKKISGKVWS